MNTMQLKRKKSKKPLFIALAVMLVAAIIVTLLWFFKPPTKDASIDSLNNLVTDSQDSIKNIKDSSSSSKNTSDNTPAEDIPVNTVGSIVITQLDQKDGLVRVNASVSNFDTEKCVYSFTADGSKPVVREQTGDCTALTIAQDYFDMIGNYTLTVTAYSSDEKLTTSQEINIL